MQKYREERNWSQYNQKLKKIAKIEFFISEEAIQNWYYNGKQKQGGKVLYSDHAIECCLLMREFYQLPYRQTQGFVESVFSSLSVDLKIPDYTTLSRRAATLKVCLRNKDLVKKTEEALIVAIDSTGLSLYTHTEWNRRKHPQNKMPGYERWRKLHVIINVKTGEILDSLTRSVSLSTVRFIGFGELLIGTVMRLTFFYRKEEMLKQRCVSSKDFS